MLRREPSYQSQAAFLRQPQEPVSAPAPSSTSFSSQRSLTAMAQMTQMTATTQVTQMIQAPPLPPPPPMPPYLAERMSGVIPHAGRGRGRPLERAVMLLDNRSETWAALEMILGTLNLLPLLVRLPRLPHPTCAELDADHLVSQVTLFGKSLEVAEVAAEYPPAASETDVIWHLLQVARSIDCDTVVVTWRATAEALAGARAHGFQKFPVIRVLRGTHEQLLAGLRPRAALYSSECVLQRLRFCTVTGCQGRGACGTCDRLITLVLGGDYATSMKRLMARRRALRTRPYLQPRDPAREVIKIRWGEQVAQH